MQLDALIEAVLFWRAEPISILDLVKYLEKSEGEIREGLDALEQKLISNESGLVMIRKDNQVTLGTHPGASELIERLTKEELSRDLGKAGLETLSIVLYKGPVARADIDYIRGVNSSFILRHLQIRDLVEKIVDPEDSRRFLYKPTFNLLQYLGVSKIEDLPDYKEVKDQLKQTTNNEQKNTL